MRTTLVLPTLASASCTSIARVSNRKNRVLLAVGAAIWIHGCAIVDYDRSNSPVASKIHGKCFELRRPIVLSEYYGWVKGYLVQAAGVNKCAPTSVDSETKNLPQFKDAFLDIPQCAYVPFAIIDAGERIQVAKVTSEAWGESGRCWKVEITLANEKYSQKLFEVPSCTTPGGTSPMNVGPLWMRLRDGGEYVEPLEFNEEFLVPCKTK